MPTKPKQKNAANLKHLLIELGQAAADGKLKAPTEFRIFKAGVTESAKGLWKFTKTSAERVMRKAKEYANDYSIDYGHGMFAFFTADPAEAGKAAGWFKPEVRDGELWATDVSWTPKAAAYIESREYRYISPAFETDETGEVMNLRNVALTNIPATYELDPLVASQAAQTEAPEERKMETLLQLLGLSKTSNEAEAIGALQRLQAPTVELLSLTGKATVAEALTVAKAWKTAADAVPEMHAKIQKLEQDQVTDKRNALISEGKKSGRVPPALEPLLQTWSVSQVEDYLKVAVPVMSPPAQPGKVDGVTITLSADELDVAKRMNISPEAFAESKKARLGAGAQSK